MNSATSNNLYLLPSLDKQTRQHTLQPRSGTEFLAFEQQAYAQARSAADDTIRRMLLERHKDDDFIREAVALARARSRFPLRHKGQEEVSVRLMGGGSVTVLTPYLAPDLRGKPGRRRSIGRRGPGGQGCYPVLRALGIEDRATPLVRSEVARNFVQAGSYEEARDNLVRMGLKLDMKTLIRLALSTGEAVMNRRDQLLEQAMELPLPEKSELAGKRIMVSTDGGKARLRRTHKRGRKRKNGRRGFVTEWKEPKGSVIHIIGEDGKIDRNYLPWSDVLMGDADALFALLVAYLRLLGAHLATQVVVVADGASWIWDRIPELVRSSGLDRSKVVEVLDLYHACNYLSQALEACRGLGKDERRELYERLRGYLVNGQHAYLIVELKRLGRGRRARKMTNAIKYFTRHRSRTAYRSYRRRRLPIGSGSMESMIRRVVNLRFKGPGIFWSKEHIEPLLHLRCILKTGRWDLVMSDLLRSDKQREDSGASAIAKAAA